VGFDKRAPLASTAENCVAVVQGDISDSNCVEELGAQYSFSTIYHLAGVLSSGGERNPLLAHSVNVTGTLNLLELARAQSEATGISVKFIFASTIAVYGMSSIEEKRSAGAVVEDEWLHPITMYGANKLYCESLGSYYSQNFGMLEGGTDRARVDFRCVRFPGLLNSHTVPTGGTSDYAPEMVHQLAQGRAYECFVREDSRLPFLMMPDAINALLLLAAAPIERLTRRVYNLAGFSPTAGEIRDLLAEHFDVSRVTFKPQAARQRIVDSWPEAVDDSAAKRDWGWNPEYSFSSGFFEYLIPEVIQMYRGEAPRAA
jgi:nucleoside-diphosphate-sugar epimerase